MRASAFLFISVALLIAGCGRGAEYYRDRGNALFDAGKYDEAALNYQKAIQKNQQFGDAFYRYGLTKLKQAQFLPAYQSLQIATQLQPYNEDAKIRLADVALTVYLEAPSHPQRFYEQVTRISDQLLSKNPNSFDGLRLKANLAAHERRTTVAVELFQRANLIRPMQAEVVMPLVQVLIADQRYTESERFALDFIKLNKAYGPMYNLLYMQYSRTGRTADAEALLKKKIEGSPSSSEGRLQLAGFYEKQNRAPEMRSTLDGLLNDRTDFPDAPLLVGDFYANLGQSDAALQYYAEGLTTPTPRRPFYQKRIALLLMRQGKQAEALKRVNDVLNEQKDDPESKTMRGTLLMARAQSGDLDSAIADFTEVVRVHPADSSARFNLGNALARKPDLNRAHTELTESLKADPTNNAARELLIQVDYRLKQFDAALQLIDEALVLRPSNLRARFLRSIVLTDLARYDDARKELQQILGAAPDSRDAQLQLGLIALAEKRYDAAAVIFRKLYHPGEQDLRPIEGLVDIDFAQNQLEKAMKLLEDETTRAPRSVPLRAVLAGTQVRAGKYDLALKQYETLAQLYPMAAEYEDGQGEVYRLKGDLTNAVAHFQRATQLEPKNPSTYNYLAYAQEASGDRQGAISSLRRSLELRADNPLVLNDLAYLLAESGQKFDEALKLIQAAQKQLPGNETITDTLGWVYLKKGLTPSALQIFGNLVMAHPDTPSYRYHHGAALLASGDPQGAKSELEAALPKIESKADQQKIKDLLNRINAPKPSA